jgi:co-chaperonin GroES (HSP10)
MIKNIEDVKPLHAIVAVREYYLESESRLVTPNSANIESMVYEVVAVGPGSLLMTGERAKPLVEPGDLVMLGAVEMGRGWTLPVAGKNLRLVPDDVILAKVGHVSTSPGSIEPPRIEQVRLQ